MERTGLKRSSVHEPSSLTKAATSTPRDFKSNTFQRQIAFYLTQTNKKNTLVTQLEMFHLLQVCLYHEMFQKLTFRWRRSCIYRGISDLTAYTAGVNARIRFISDLCPHMNEAWNRSENIRIHVNCSCINCRGPYSTCATWEEQNLNWVTWTMQ